MSVIYKLSVYKLMLVILIYKIDETYSFFLQLFTDYLLSTLLYTVSSSLDTS